MAIDNYQVNIYDYLAVLRKRAGVIIALMIVCVTLGAIVTVTVRESFVATATLLFTDIRRGDTGTGLGGIGQAISSFVSPAQYGYQWDDILKSQMMSMRVAKILGKSNYAGINVSRARGGGSGIYTISCTSSDRKYAAQMANAYVQALYEYEQENARQIIEKKMTYLAEKMAETQKSLDVANQQMVAFQRENKALSINREADIYTGLATTLKREIIEEEAELETALKTHSFSHPEVLALQDRIEAKKNLLEEEIRNALYPAGDSNGRKDTALLTNVIEKGLAFAKLEREVTLQTRLYNLLAEEYQKNRIAADQSFEPFKILDYAVPPRHPSFPNPKQNIILGATVGLILGIVLSFFLEYLEQVKKSSRA